MGRRRLSVQDFGQNSLDMGRKLWLNAWHKSPYYSPVIAVESKILEELELWPPPIA